MQKASGATQSKTEKDEMSGPSPLVRQKKGEIPLSSAFGPVQALTGVDSAHPHWVGVGR